uniref:Aromatic-L-amino-acid decarboxylase n=1 Tax=Echinococcus granulosus TaxID=6210 RepID=A0A068WY04_ECHGR|nr:aromatic amino acid decarboxylase [Echinococcus granulosus]
MASNYFSEMQASCKAAVDKTVNYLKGVELYRPFPIVRPGFLVHQLPADPPQEGVKMETILEDVDRLLLPGVAHWNHPHIHAHFAMTNSYPAMFANIISSGMEGIGFTWASSPVSTELEVVMTNWLVKMLGLPDFYLHNVSGGGGVIGTTCSEQAVVTMMAARNKAIEKYIADHPGATNYKAMSKLVCYGSVLAHCSIERAGLLNLLPYRSLPVNENFELTGKTLESAIMEDIAMGKVPFYVCLSSTLTRARKSDIKESGIDEYRDVKSVASTFSTDAQYLKYDEVGKMPDYRNWQLSFGRKFRSIKLWFVIRKFGVGGLQGYIRQHIRMAKYLESLIRTDPRFEIICGVVLGLVCFRIKNNNEMTKELYKMIEEDGRIHLVTSKITGPDMKEIFFIRIAIVYLFTDEETCSFAYNVICEIADKLMGSYQNKPANGQIRYENVSK